MFKKSMPGCWKRESLHYLNLRFWRIKGVFVLLAEHWTLEEFAQVYLCFLDLENKLYPQRTL